MRNDEQGADWTVLAIEGVGAAIASTVARFLRDWEWLEPRREDIEQEARELVATRPDLRDAAARLVTDPGLLAYRLRSDLRDRYKSHQRTINDKERPLEPWSATEGRWLPAAETLAVTEAHTGSSDTYSEGDVRALLPLVWDATYAYPASPAGGWAGSPPSRSRHPAEVADVARAWRGTVLTAKQRQALMLWAMDCGQRESATIVGIAQPTLQKRLKVAKERVLTFLNGEAISAEVGTSQMLAA